MRCRSFRRPRTTRRTRRAPRVTTGGAWCPPRRRARRRGTRAWRGDRPDARSPRTCTPRRRTRGDPRARVGLVPRHPMHRLRPRKRRTRGRWRHARSPPRRGSSWTSSVGPRRRRPCFASAPPGPSPPRTGGCPGAGAAPHPRRRRFRSRHCADASIRARRYPPRRPAWRTRLRRAPARRRRSASPSSPSRAKRASGNADAPVNVAFTRRANSCAPRRAEGPKRLRHEFR